MSRFEPHRVWVSAVASDRGKERFLNQDRFLALPSRGLFLVADGMGGAPAGELAADLAIGLVSDAITNPSIVWPATIRPPPSNDKMALLVAAIERANLKVFRQAEGTPLHGMGSTIAAMLADGPNAAIAHLGDSRIYRLRQGTLTPLTEDHTVYNEWQRRGATKAEIDALERPHALTRVIGGVSESAWPDRNRILVETGDLYMLSTDGVHGVLGDALLRALLGGCTDLEEAAATIVDCANQRGGPDNITLVLVRAEERL